MSEKQVSNSTESKEKKERSKAKSEQKKREERLQKKLKNAEKEIEVLKDRLLRTAAELDNFRKRTERDISRIIENANEKLIKDILPVIDDLERSLKLSNEKQNEKEFRRGVELIYQKLMAVLKSYGLEPIESENKEFDVEQHEALLQVEKEGTPPGIVVEEHEKGYLLNGKVLRHAKVVVSK